MDPINWLYVAVAVAVLFGAKRIPEMARSLGRAQAELKKGLREGAVDGRAGAWRRPERASDDPLAGP